ncbi:SoxR reducing system RseC family protein [Clostridium frigoris]|uniref:SoxR reducing system RseC family protein n=1 Tax=Clostridium frigoris TaxID=205327 RepID=A0ABS6BV86_9CLOT|nr:SoxR reducing system RseC family protein [Clostridium frigoris]MBU3160838.1 SoxR reducing system RseC family protein [Clostridium frigoris]
MKINQSKKDIKKVTFKVKKTNMLLASFVLFVFPIMAVVIGVFLGQYIGKFIGSPIQVSRIFGGIIGLIIAIILIELFDKSAAIDEKNERIYWEDL